MPDPKPPLDRLNQVFIDHYDASRSRKEAEDPVVVVLGDALHVFRDGGEASFVIRDAAFHLVKAVAHAPVAAYLALRRPGASKDVGALSARVAEARARLDDDPALVQLTPLLDRVAAVLALGAPTAAELEAFARDAGELLLGATELATRIHLDLLHARVNDVLAAIGPERTPAVRVVVCGDHQARVRSLAMQYFRKRFGEPEGAEERVFYAEGVEDAREARELVGTARADRELARAFFGDPRRLQRDVLGDAAKACLEAFAMDRVPPQS